jgi:mannonate dehydratase
MGRLDRRLFARSLAGILGSIPLLAGARSENSSCSDKPVLDIHVHLFGVGDSGSGCTLSKVVRQKLTVKYLFRSFQEKTEQGKTLDEAYVDFLVDQVQHSGLNKVVLLAQDGVYDSSGLEDSAKTHVYVPNDYVFSIASRYPHLFVPCPSINPDRKDSLGELERCAERGARILKIHPPIQGVDISDKKHTRFFARCAELEMIVMVHTGHEHSAPLVDKNLADPRKLQLALEQGCIVIACHCGSGWPGEKPDFLPHFVDMVRRHDRLFGDTSVLGSAFRVRDVGRLLREEDILPRLLHGSDFPFPSTPRAFSFRIGFRPAHKLQGESNLLKRDLALKETLGFGRESAERAYTLSTSDVRHQGLHGRLS